MNNEYADLQTFLKGLVELPEMGYYDYEWDRFVSYYDPRTEMFYWLSDSGCSCNDLWEDVNSVGDMYVGRKSEFLSAAASFGDGGAHGYGQGRYAGEFEALRKEVDSL